MKRIAILAGFPPHALPSLADQKPRGHFATWLPQIARCYASASEFDIHWLMVSKTPISSEPIEYLGQTFHYLHVPGRLKALSGYTGNVRALNAALSRLSPDLVHAWGTEDSYGLAASVCKYPWVLSIQGIIREYIRQARMHPLEHLQAVYEWFILRRAKEITVESKWGEKVIQKLAPRARIHRVEYGVQELYFDAEWKPDSLRPRAIFIGTTDDRKGIEEAVRAFADSRLANCELLIAGDSSSRLAKKLRQQSPPNVRWLGRLSAHETMEALTTAWCLVLPTRADTSPNVVKEARVIGMPVVTTPNGGQSDYIEDGVNGFIVQPGDVETLASRISTLLSDFELTSRMGAARRAEQRDWFRPERTAEGFLRLYRELA